MKRIPFFVAAILALGNSGAIIAQTSPSPELVEEAAKPEKIKKERKKKPEKDAELSEAEQRKRFFAGVEAGNIDEVERWYTPLSHLQHSEAGETALTLAIQKQDEAMVAYLSEKAVINLKNKAGETPLTLALKQGNPSIIQSVMRRAKADLPNNSGETPLMLALEKGNLALVQQLIDRGALVERTANGITSLYYAVSLNKLEAAAILLRAGANPSQPNENGETPLLMAVRNKRSDVAELLLNKSPNPAGDANWKTQLGEPLLHLAIQQNDPLMAGTLLKHGALPNEGDYLENTGLHLSLENGDAQMAKVLLSAGADPNRPNLLGLTPVQLAGKNGHEAILGALDLQKPEAAFVRNEQPKQKVITKL